MKNITINNEDQILKFESQTDSKEKRNKDLEFHRIEIIKAYNSRKKVHKPL